MAIELANGSKVYQLGDLVAETYEYRIYICTEIETGRRCLLQITTHIEHNGGLDRAAFVLRELERKANELEEEYAKLQTKKKNHMPLNYGLAFPELVDTFICIDQGRRRVNVIAFRGVDDVSMMVPLTNITTKNHLRVDLRSSVWIMGKLLKLLAFAHSEGFAIKLMSGSNTLIEKDKHYVLVFDWSCAQAFPPSEVPAQQRRHDIAGAAYAVISVMGGNPKTGEFPPDGEDFDEYYEFLRRLVKGGESDAKKAHQEFYAMVDAHWPREYYPFTTRPMLKQG